MQQLQRARQLKITSSLQGKKKNTGVETSAMVSPIQRPEGTKFIVGCLVLLRGSNFFFFILFCVLETKKSITGEPLMVFWALQHHFLLRQRDVFQSDACQGAQL